MCSTLRRDAGGNTGQLAWLSGRPAPGTETGELKRIGHELEPPDPFALPAPDVDDRRPGRCAALRHLAVPHDHHRVAVLEEFVRREPELIPCTRGSLQDTEGRSPAGVLISHRQVRGDWALPYEVVGPVSRGCCDIAAVERGVSLPDPIDMPGHLALR